MRNETKVTYLKDDDEHLGCYSYPNCDIDPLGCTVDDDDYEEYGHRDSEEKRNELNNIH